MRVDPVTHPEMDVIVLDDNLFEVGTYMLTNWQKQGVTLLQSVDPFDLAEPFNAEPPPKWPRVPHYNRLGGVLLDLDLGGKDPNGAIGGMLGAWVMRSAKNQYGNTPVVLRTTELDRERDLAAVFAAELYGAPLPWFDRAHDDDDLLDYLRRRALNPNAELPDGMRMIHPVRVRNVDADGEAFPETTLAEALLRGERWKLWPNAAQFGGDSLPGTVIGRFLNGYLRGNSSPWRNTQRLMSALYYLRDTGQLLHQLSEPIDVAAVLEEANGRYAGQMMSHKMHAMGIVSDYRKVLTNPQTARLFAEADTFEYQPIRL